MIFISGAYGGNKRNKEIAEECARYLYRHFEKDIYVSGIFSFAREYENIPIEDCLELLKLCNKILFLSSYKNSDGAKIEYEFALKNKLEMYLFDLDTREIRKIDEKIGLEW